MPRLRYAIHWTGGFVLGLGWTTVAYYFLVPVIEFVVRLGGFVSPLALLFPLLVAGTFVSPFFIVRKNFKGLPWPPAVYGLVVESISIGLIAASFVWFYPVVLLR